jgi:hypothetical protein
MTQTIDPVQFDTQLFALYEQHSRLEDKLRSLFSFKIHPMAGDRQESNGWGRPRTWRLDDVAAFEAVVCLRHAGDERVLNLGVRPSDVINSHDQLDDAITELRDQINALEYVYQQNPWTRWHPCLNADGHVHSSLRGCPTVRWDTRMGWATKLSGTPVETAIQMPPVGLGPRLCSVCFPEAPVEHCRSLPEINREARLTAKAARAEAKFVKNLRPEEMANPDGSRLVDGGGWKIETVAACEKALRDEVEHRDCYGRGPSPSYENYLSAAQACTRILLARGYEQARIDKIIENAVKRNRRDGARI